MTHYWPEAKGLWADILLQINPRAIISIYRTGIQLRKG